MKKFTFLLLIFLINISEKISSQSIYGFSDKYFCSYDVSDFTKDTLITFAEPVWLNLSFRSAMDRYNGRYFFGGTLPGHNGSFHIIDLVDLTITSSYHYPDNIEYDFIKNRLVYENNGMLYELNLTTMQMKVIGLIEHGNSDIYGQKRTFVPQTGDYFYIDYIEGTTGDPYFLLINSSTGEINCQEVMEENNGIFYSPGGLVTNNLNGDIIGHRNGRFGIVNSCEGTMTKLSQIPDYYAHLNNQMAVYNHENNTYIIPYYSTNPNDRFKVAIVDVYNNEILKIQSQPWEGTMNMEQIYEKPIAQLVYLNDTLFVPKGQHYKWYLNDEFIGESTDNFWVPTIEGKYKAEVKFREYTTFSSEKEITLTSIKKSDFSKNLKIYPNPTSDLITIDFNFNSSIKVKIIDVNGKILFEEFFSNQSKLEINLTDYIPGPYTLILSDKDHSTSELIFKI